ncbi:VOC family protein [Ancylobacter sp. Lp-2]|uniref:VOC family protein n=1 Tax=Ancylobacter sp. Lp-2 TaxID=2881339 RepID=UPI001E284F7D|nr:VOC family protein [Ancylobacter sp. Lp-2]MCB4770543.1 VOC family protein [Ancylobacter sp. Lp-2]
MGVVDRIAGADCRTEAGDGVPPLALSLVTLGVADLARAAVFYEAMGMVRRDRATTGVAFYQADGRRQPGAGGVVLALYPRHELAADAGVIPGRAGSFGGIALACNRPSRAEVDATLSKAVAAGGRALRPAQETFWGGYSGYVADPDGYPWEVAHNPGFALDAEGRVVLPE